MEMEEDEVDGNHSVERDIHFRDHFWPTRIP